MHRVTWASHYLQILMASLFLAVGSLMAQPPTGGSLQDSSSPGSASLDFEFFKTKVQPIFLARRPGHARCVACHATNNSALHLEPLSAGSKSWNDDESRKNFESVKKVVIPGNVKSPLLVHALAEQAGGDFFHSGGKHFNSQNDPEWQTLKSWVFGATAK